MLKALLVPLAAVALLAAPLSAEAAGKMHKHHGHQMMMMVQGKMRPIFAMVNGHMVPVPEASESANGM